MSDENGFVKPSTEAYKHASAPEAIADRAEKNREEGLSPDRREVLELRREVAELRRIVEKINVSGPNVQGRRETGFVVNGVSKEDLTNAIKTYPWIGDLLNSNSLYDVALGHALIGAMTNYPAVIENFILQTASADPLYPTIGLFAGLTGAGNRAALNLRNNGASAIVTAGTGVDPSVNLENAAGDTMLINPTSIQNARNSAAELANFSPEGLLMQLVDNGTQVNIVPEVGKVIQKITINIGGIDYILIGCMA